MKGLRGHRVATVRASLVALLLVLTAGAGVALAYKLEPGTYAGTVTPPALQYGGANPFRVSFHFNGKTISKLQVGPIKIDCDLEPGDVTQVATLGRLTFPTVKGRGFLDTGFVLRDGHWKQSAYEPITTKPNASFDMVYDPGHPPRFVPNGGSEPGMALILKANVVNGRATVSDTGKSTCALDDLNPTLKRQ